MLPRVLEPEVMETADEADEYDRMSHQTVNRVFVDDLLTALAPLLPASPLRVFDAGTGTALIPIELAQRLADCSILAADAAEEMLRIGRENVARAGLADRIELGLRDCKALPETDALFDIVMSNSLVHHLPAATDMFRECWRILKPGGLLFVRDLYRPTTTDEVERLVATYAGQENPTQQQLFRQSLHAALTVAEVEELLDAAGLSMAQVGMTSDRHWTVVSRKSEPTL